MSSIESFKAAYEKHKKTPAGMKAQKAKAAHKAKQMKSGIPKFDSGKVTGKVVTRKTK